MNDLAQQLTPELQRKERTAQLVWTVFVLMFFAIQGIIWTVAISITSSDLSHAVVAGYDEQALNWDNVKQLQADSNALCWDAKIDVEIEGDIRGKREITIRLNDRYRSPLENAQVELTAFHRGQAAKKQSVKFESGGPGIYSSALLIRDSGWWQFSGTAKLGNDVFLFEQRITLQTNRSQ